MFASKDLFLTRPSGGYTISRSVRLRSSASAYFNRTAGTPTNANIWTWSAWVKRGTLTTRNVLFCGGATNVNYICFGDSASTDNFGLTYSNSPSQLVNVQSTAVYRDLSSWYHLMVVYDSTSATSTITGSATDRVRLYVNGVQLTSFTATTPPAQNTSVNINAASAVLNLGRRNIASPDSYLDGYLTEINFIDGQALTPSSFGSTNATTGVWQPAKYTGTYGTNGFYLNFSSNGTAAALGTDFSGNSNTWTVNNISVTAGTTYDSMLDVPTPYADGGNGRGNYAVLNPLWKGANVTISNGNLTASNTVNAFNPSISTVSTITSGKTYWENTLTALGDAYRLELGVVSTSYSLSAAITASTPAAGWQQNAGNTSGIFYVNGSSVFTVANVNAANDIFMFAYDDATNRIWVGKNGTWFNSGDPAAGIGYIGTLTSGNSYFPAVQTNTASTANTVNINFGQRPFTYTPPSGYSALNTYNLSTPTIANGASYMAASTYTGNGSTQSIVNSGNNAGAVSFKPDLVWIKSRSAATDHKLTDSVRGVTKALISDTTGAETTDTNGMTAFNANGFSIGTDSVYNTNAATYVGWQWQAGQGSTSSNTSGSITSTVSVNATAGFSVVTYTGTGANATVGHGLGVAPKMLILKSRSNARDWPVYHTSIGAGNYLALNTTAASTALATMWNSTAPTSTVFSVGSALTSNDTSMVAYCFSAVAGYSAFGSYTGNGSTDGPFVYLGFRPRFILLKPSSGIGNWTIIDTSRSTYNVCDAFLYPNLSNAEASSVSTPDILSNGFKLRSIAGYTNDSGVTYIYAAFAENPFKYALAR